MFIKAKKSLGQNFLKSKSAIKKIIEAGSIKTGDTILEIGPGTGILTEEILKFDIRLICIETDFEMIQILKEKFSKEILTKKLTLISGDITKIKLSTILEKNTKYKIIANIPYYITGEIIRKFLSAEKEYQPEKMVLLVQKEVAQRIVAKDKKESLLSISVKVYCEPKIIDVVKAGSFVPAPKVDSAIILFDKISKDFFIKNKIKENLFFEIIHAGFAHKRKRVLSNLKKIKNIKETDLPQSMKNERAENLTITDWLNFIK
ncbi:MAG TPA: 16S rRNA (adenine(1518)-N(6)/adenine(1519)-N(6))-dimethyltransferase RsmA [Candidatus Paceibacterota bacterium]|nr:16S rRNA (adenine(1518)-N(6)/adenine(1519)-N(6))-dimethyltransferase RsmA [Candidatus Paceibacterota bacterium]HMP19004.1 16S rRNA (adenine(1518)-N(6)/adenine(1519)-N(6))-dimethyltransferase RsmA [Candidatus Paceibacterota bacterium]HMP85381.1 16S rRNA (adenine(1518)-N(6)/adenine(1519)-N(6))-dimethyltransferase RsmA [Candidatus Paceibacterota bacterium]